MAHKGLERERRSLHGNLDLRKTNKRPSGKRGMNFFQVFARRSSDEDEVFVLYDVSRKMLSILIGIMKDLRWKVKVGRFSLAGYPSFPESSPPKSRFSERKLE